MEETADIYYVDTRNADRDHRGPSRPMMGTMVPGTRMPAGWSAATPAVRAPTVYGPMPATPSVIYAPAPSIGASILSKLSTGDVITIVASLFAALQTLPGAPSPTKDAATDAGNLILYQAALAQHAKRDEQVRTLGNLVAKLVG